MARTVLVTPAQRRAAEALVEWYEVTSRPVADSLRRIAAPESLVAEATRSIRLTFAANPADLPPVVTDAVTKALKAYRDAAQDLVAAYDVAVPNWSKNVALAVLRLELFRMFRRAAPGRRPDRRPENPGPEPEQDAAEVVGPDDPTAPPARSS